MGSVGSVDDRPVLPRGTSGGQLTASEQERDNLVQQLPCPDCGVAQGVRCCFGLKADGQPKVPQSCHTGRYLLAVEAGLVPPWAGWPWTG